MTFYEHRDFIKKKVYREVDYQFHSKPFSSWIFSFEFNCWLRSHRFNCTLILYRRIMLDIIFLNGDKKRSEWTMVGGLEERKRISCLMDSWGNRRYENARDHQASSTCSLAIILLKINTSASIVPIAFQCPLLTTVSCAFNQLHGLYGL